MKRLALLILLSLFQGYLFQENAGTSLSPSLIECYNNTYLSTKDNLLPSTINSLITLIRKIEIDNPTLNARELSVQLLHRFRQDGIVKNEKQPSTTYGIPYSPRRFESYKNRVQLKLLTPNTMVTFNNNSLKAIERCSLHSYISSTIKLHERGDEGTTCNVISRYTLRTKRKRDQELTERVPDTSSSLSSCPIEEGVVYTKWGAVKAGLLISGIAAGFEQMYVPTANGKRANNIFSSTIAGELSEAALYQDSDVIKIGAKGGWKNNLLPQYYYIQENTKLQVTDAEIRGGLDGLYMGLTINSWKQTSKAIYDNVKVSQILEAYYSPRGLFDQNIRACNRKSLLKTFIKDENTLVDEVTNFNYLLDVEAIYSYTPNHDYFPVMAKTAVKSFTAYLNNLNDLDCSAEEVPVNKEALDLLIFLDTAWNYDVIRAVLSYFLSSLNLKPYGTQYTIMDGTTTNPLVNTTSNITDFYEKMNVTDYQKHASGLDYKQVFVEIDNYFTNRLNNISAINGVSTIALLIPHTAPTADELSNVENKKNSFKTYLPDLKILTVGYGNVETYNDVVFTSSKDVFALAADQYVEDSATKTLVKSLVTRIQEIPRGIVNPKCGSLYTFDTSTFDVIQFVDPLGINYYRISPNYFHEGDSDQRNLKIRGMGYGSLSVCMSRTISNPRANSTNQDCKTIISDESSYSLLGYCNGDSTTACAPIYISVEGVSSNKRCTEQLCPFPDSIKFQITLENVGCSSASRVVIQSIFLIAFVLFLIY